jgi:hypothetical protein
MGLATLQGCFNICGTFSRGTYLLGFVVAPRDDTPVLPVDPSVQGIAAVAAVPTVGATGQDLLSGELDFAFRSDAESVDHGFDWTEAQQEPQLP